MFLACVCRGVPEVTVVKPAKGCVTGRYNITTVVCLI